MMADLPGIAEQTHHLKMGLHALVVGGAADLPQGLPGIRHPTDGRFFGARSICAWVGRTKSTEAG